ncbi:MAG: 30S ribosomal protein S11 [Candidatus Levybacteria bacterium RIFCSPLOWO2_01_FULL_38_13]|nr:MAG: 30S ribosomal protein S11 [Candidatus Levybacteria bacterium RIFCSPHIGHO2_01_FULL_41_15]OGH34753.1 MAG: 30S ribosomal protein S11 [Candidatus Levybacteria bacterium RIFCSPLOWO2_01_FULL_38_13]
MAKKIEAVKSKKKTGATVTEHGRIYITSTFNNTLVNVTNNKGDTISWGSSGAAGFKGTRKSTPYAATVAMEQAVKKAVEKGLKIVDVYIKGPGSGRDSALRAVRSGGLSISLISDITPIPHNGPRPKKKRRV